ncbi:MAG TPA: hypothetical protein VI300_25520 [Solirubrobacter sp.]
MKSWRAVAAVGLVVAACGSTKPNRLDLTTPGAHTGDPLRAATAAPSETATPTPDATAKPSAGKVTAAEKRIIKGWSDSLRQGRVEAASRYFQIPVLISNNTPGYIILGTQDEVMEFNRTLPCGAKLIRTRRGADGFVVGDFKLTERKNAPAPCGTGVGATASVAFEIDKGHITKWVRVVETTEQDPMGTPSPTPEASATPVPTIS